jgi:hypothetical protein
MIFTLLKTYLFVCLLLKSARTHEIGYCEKDDLNCNTINTPILKIRNWWQEMAIQKPVKCRTPSYWIHQSQILNVFSKMQPIVSVTCNQVKNENKNKKVILENTVLCELCNTLCISSKTTESHHK